MLKTLTFIRHNAIALLALFVALGGTSYAAIGISNHSIEPVQLNPRDIGGGMCAPGPA